VGKPWEPLRGIPVDREGEYTFPLRSHTERYSIRLLCEVKVEDNVKVVTIRSTYKIENHTFYPVELTLVSDTGQPISSLEKIGVCRIPSGGSRSVTRFSAPGEDYSLPLGAVGQNRIKLQPDREPVTVEIVGAKLTK
jgi:vacuolar protein sorting-associated protein 13A/C